MPPKRNQIEPVNEESCEEEEAERTSRVQTDRQLHVRSRRTPHVDLNLAAFNYVQNYNYDLHPKVVIGRMDQSCQFCRALKFKNETAGMCCANGQVKLPDLRSPPQTLRALVAGETSESKHFLKNIRKYNSAFQMTSFGATETFNDEFMPTFKCQGQIYHRAGSLLPLPNEEHQFLQIYFMGDADQRIE
ncbi:uncharacterized protein LOC114828554, partial [Galendromus occidentalis]|uniref:Uncharacterized protein LOC114828554 n=1 Tax=Galendromus occidentalis TaxID=34638 RepID=A0AAJ7WJ69_9ACAR